MRNGSDSAQNLMNVPEATRVDMRKMGRDAKWMFVQSNRPKFDKSSSVRAPSRAILR